jgi:hypothetical protein
MVLFVLVVGWFGLKKGFLDGRGKGGVLVAIIS